MSGIFLLEGELYDEQGSGTVTESDARSVISQKCYPDLERFIRNVTWTPREITRNVTFVRLPHAPASQVELTFTRG